MRKIKVLFSMALIAVMLCTVAFASAGAVFTPVEYDGVADTITVELKASEAIVIDSFSSIWMTYDSSIVEYVSATTDAENATVADQKAYSYVEFENSAGDSSVTPDMCLIKAVFNVIDKANVENASFGIGEGCFASYAGGVEVLDLSATMTVTKKAAGPATTESEVVSGTVKGHEIVGGGTTEDRTYFAKQLTLTGAEGKTVKGITTIFTPVYAEGSGKTVNPVTKSYDFDIAEGIAGGASLKFNVTLIGAPADVVNVDIQSTLTVE